MYEEREKCGEWRPVPNIDSSMALVSSEGWVRVRTKSKGGVQALGPPQRGSQSSGTGTMRVGIDGKTYLVHRLIALAFLGKQPSKGHTVDHLNRNEADNRVANLRWATRPQQRTNQGKRKIQRTAKPVVLTSPSGEVSAYPSTIAAGKAIGANPGNISNAVHRGWTVNGYIAQFKAEEDQGNLVLDGEVERWAKAPEDPDLHVSTMGRVQWNRWSVMGLRVTPKPNKRLAGYCFVHVGDSDMLVHHLVMKTFGASPPASSENYTIDHINHIRHDNRLSNLRWATAIEQRANRATSAVDPSELPLAPDNIECAVRKQHYRRTGMPGKWIVRMHRERRMWIRARGATGSSMGNRTVAQTAACSEAERRPPPPAHASEEEGELPPTPTSSSGQSAPGPDRSTRPPATASGAGRSVWVLAPDCDFDSD